MARPYAPVRGAVKPKRDASGRCRRAMRRVGVAPFASGRTAVWRRRVLAYADMEEVLETERLRLSPLTEADLDDLVELDGDPEVRRMVDPHGILIPVDPNDRRTFEWERIVMPGGFYGARERVGNAFVGWFQLEGAPDREDEAELGYRFRRNAWGLGYATEGARALVRHALEVLGYRRVFAHALTDNPASIRVLEKVGLTFVGPWSYRGLPGAEYAIERDGPRPSPPGA
jgi:RimJ/RimL family protein N-acetyltransferase